MAKYVYFFGEGKADGTKEMKARRVSSVSSLPPVVVWMIRGE